MRAAIVGGGPAGLYCGLLLKKADPAREVAIYERNPRGATYGWGIVFSDRTLQSFRDADSRSYAQIVERFVSWDSVSVHHRGEVVRCGGHVFAAVARAAF